MNKLQSGAPFCHEDFSNDGSGVKTKPPRVWQLKVGFCLQHPHGLRNVTGDPFLPSSFESLVWKFDSNMSLPSSRNDLSMIVLIRSCPLSISVTTCPATILAASSIIPREGKSAMLASLATRSNQHTTLSPSTKEWKSWDIINIGGEVDMVLIRHKRLASLSIQNIARRLLHLLLMKCLVMRAAYNSASQMICSPTWEIQCFTRSGEMIPPATSLVFWCWSMMTLPQRAIAPSKEASVKTRIGAVPDVRSTIRGFTFCTKPTNHSHSCL